MKTHAVLNLVYTEYEGNVDFVGTHIECVEYVSKQCQYSEMANFMLKVVPLTKQELKIYNDE